MSQPAEQSLRQSYIDAARSVTPFDEAERDDISKAVLWLESASHVHKPSSMTEHLGVMCLLLSGDRRQVFLLNHKKARMWLPPGGHVDEGLTLLDAVRVEVREEIGQDATLLSPTPFFLVRVLTGGLNAGHIDVTFWYLLEGDTSASYVVQDKEATEALWFPVEAMMSMPEASNLPRVYAKLTRSVGH